jgi:hypothetical protein
MHAGMRVFAYLLCKSVGCVHLHSELVIWAAVAMSNVKFIVQVHGAHSCLLVMTLLQALPLR